MDNLTNSADSAHKSKKSRAKNARKPRRKKFYRAKKHKNGNTRQRQCKEPLQRTQVPSCSSKEKSKPTGQSDDQEQMGLGCMSDSDCSDQDVLNISGVGELPADEPQLDTGISPRLGGTPCQLPSNEPQLETGMSPGAGVTLCQPSSNEPQCGTGGSPCRDTSGGMIVEGVDNYSAFVEIKMTEPDSVTIKRVMATPVAEMPRGERYAEAPTLVSPGPPIIPHVGEFRYSERDQTKALLERVCRQLITTLPSLWLPIVKTDGTYVGLFAENASLVIQRSLFVAPDGTTSAEVHGRKLPPDHCYWKNVKSVPLTPDSVDDYANNVLQMVHALASLEMCTGVEQYEHFWKRAVNCEVDSNLYHEEHYKKTCRSTFCPLLFEKGKKSRCEACSRVFRIFMYREKRRSSKATDSPAKFAANCYLTTPQQRKRLRTKNAQLRAERQRNNRLTDRINALVAQEGLEVDENTADDVTKILETAKSTPGLTDVQLLFIQEQLKAAKARPRGMKWHPAIIRFALAIRMSSPAAYNVLSGVLKLPSERQLFDYSHAVSPKEGVHPEIVADLVAELKKSGKRRFQKYHVLSFDEIHIKKNLVFDKTTGNMIGYVKLDELQLELRALNEKLDSEVLQCPPDATDRSPPVAEKVLCYMVNGVANSIKSVVACYPVATLTKELLHRLTWEVVGMLEGVGIKIISLVCDGAGVNRAFYQMLKRVTITESGVVFDTVNLYAPHRVLYLMQDPPHLLKTSRNCLNNSGKKNKKGQYIRIMQKNGQDIVWGSIVRLYHLESGNTVRMLFKLNQEDVYLNPYSVMRVSLAAHVLSQSVADALRILGWTECEELAKFCETMNEFFDILNGAHSHQGHREKNDNFNPFRDAEDPRFKRLEEIWEYFEDWKKDAYKTAEAYLRKQGQKITRTRLDAEAHKRTLSTETLNGLERTIKGFIGAMKFVLRKSEDGDMKPYIMAKAYQQDDLENYFSKMRSLLGGNRHPDLSELLRCHARLHVQSKLSFRGSKRTNAGSRSMPSLDELSKPVPKRTRKKL